MNLGRRRKSARRQAKQFFNVAVKLSRRREQAVLTGSWLRRETITDFALHHEHDSFKVFSVSEEAQQNFGSDEIGKIAHDLYSFGLMVHAWTGAARLGSEKRVEIDGENIALDYFDVRGQGKLHAQLGCENAIQFDGDEPSRSSSEQGSQCAAPSAYFEHRALR